MLELAAAEYRLVLAPERGGSVLRFDWRGQPLFRPVCGASILDVASFPLVPFSNRIAWGRFRMGERDVALRPNFPGSDHPHVLHGFGWLAPWDVAEVAQNRAVLVHGYPGGEWPWPYRAEQRFELDERGLAMILSVTNLGIDPMPAGLGFHPYFPRDRDTVYRGLHRGEWQNDADCLPQHLIERATPVDWWDGAPAGSRCVDTAYEGREGVLSIRWPGRGYGVGICPSDNLARTVVYTPAGQDFLCVESVSHMTDAFNREMGDTGHVQLAPGDTEQVNLIVRAEAI
ncbi:MAG TPA: aldose 1-epimerase [Sphingobium sp.]|uniref:aldose 1-epimerase n=1 Tax=Sphingobium sp. TaxID=1912891 RepID=UPI002ED3FDFA